MVAPTYAAPSTGRMAGRSMVKSPLQRSTSIARTSEISSDVETVTGSTETNSNIDAYNAQRAICLGNNMASGDVFVWAARTSNTDNYSTMIEDVYNPGNNVCFVLVKMRSNDIDVNLSDIKGKYFPMGSRITCGEWVDKEKIEQRILEGKQSSRTWATVAGSVGGAGVGVGAMELFGNRLIGGAVMGQKDLEGDDLFLSQLKVLRNNKDKRYDAILAELKQIKQGCDKKHIPECDKIDYEKILNGLEEK